MRTLVSLVRVMALHVSIEAPDIGENMRAFFANQLLRIVSV